uniref:(northern house mosquito) hypothetical protein n=1 Tax=Culex pipiens TaxID=7175 RepID=A0A8D8AGZ7_CULPI
MGPHREPHGTGEGFPRPIPTAKTLHAGTILRHGSTPAREGAAVAPDGVATHQQLPRDAQLERRHDRPAAVPVLPDEPAGLAGLVHRRVELPLGALPDGSGAGGGAVIW